MGEQEDLVGGLDPARLEEHLLAVDDAEAARREGGEDGHLDDVDAEWLVRQTVLGEDVVDLGGDVVGEPGGRRDGAAQRRQTGSRAVRAWHGWSGEPAWAWPWSSHGLYSWWWRAAEPKSQTIGSPPRGMRAKRISLSIAHVPMWVAVA